MTQKNSSSVLCVLDTNVILTANNQQEDVSYEDAAKCIEIVKEVANGQRRLVVDKGDEIAKEYRKNVNMDKQMGKAFMIWFFQNLWNSTHVDRVVITKKGYTYAEFPKDDGLKEFDPSDRKFIAVACAHSAKPYIMQATDSKWWGFRDVFKRLGICVCFLCEDYVKQKYQKKQRQR